MMDVDALSKQIAALNAALQKKIAIQAALRAEEQLTAKQRAYRRRIRTALRYARGGHTIDTSKKLKFPWSVKMIRDLFQQGYIMPTGRPAKNLITYSTTAKGYQYGRTLKALDEGRTTGLVRRAGRDVVGVDDASGNVGATDDTS